MNLYAVPLLLAGLLMFLNGLFIFWNNKKSEVNIAFALFNLSCTIWLFGYSSVYYFAKTEEVALNLVKFLYIGVLFIPSTFYHFNIKFLKIERKKIYIKLFYLASFVLVGLLYATPYVISGVYKYFWGYYAKGSFLHTLYLGLLGFSVFRCLFLLYVNSEAKKQKEPLESLRIKYIFWAFTIGFMGGFQDFVPNYGIIEFYPLGSIFVAIAASVIAYTIIHLHLLDIKLVFTRAGILTLVYALVLGIPFGLGAFINKAEVYRLWFLPMILMAVLATAGPFIYRRLQQKAEDILLAKQKHYQRLLLQAGEGMVREHNLDKLLNLIVHIVKKAVKIKFAAIFFHDKANKAYTLKAVRDHKAISPDIALKEDSSLIKYIKIREGPFLSEEMPYGLRKPLQEKLNSSFDLIVPSLIEDRMLGFLILGQKLNKTTYTQDDINVFNILSHQTALAVDYCVFLEEFKKSQQRLFTAEKLASIGGMASGVAHQIRNRLGVFSAHAGTQELEIQDFIEKHPDLIIKYPDLKKTFDRLIEEAGDIQDNVQRAGKLIKGILDFAGTQEREISFSFFPLQETIDLSISPLRAKHSISDDFPLEIRTENTNTIIYASKGQMAEVIFNFIDNSYEAIMEKINLCLNEDEKAAFKPFIEIKLKETEASFIIQISDNGIGMKEEDKLRIFSPYFTTKISTISGTGIGMFVVKRIIEENHRGKIWFESTYMKGTTFFIELPKKKG
ncbi:MAG: ATP-binding protein [Candidatus Omnitrophota bacterium]